MIKLEAKVVWHPAEFNDAIIISKRWKTYELRVRVLHTLKGWM